MRVEAFGRHQMRSNATTVSSQHKLMFWMQKLDFLLMQWVVTRESERPLSLASSSTRELVTLIETVSRDGLVLPPMLIAARKLHMTDWYTKTNIPDTYLIGVSDTGYSNEK